jgi:hypothetical protein
MLDSEKSRAIKPPGRSNTGGMQPCFVFFPREDSAVVSLRRFPSGRFFEIGIVSAGLLSTADDADCILAGFD